VAIKLRQVLDRMRSDDLRPQHMEIQVNGRARDLARGRCHVVAFCADGRTTGETRDHCGGPMS
jgi:hypothetical protein